MEILGEPPASSTQYDLSYDFEQLFEELIKSLVIFFGVLISW